jgi:hypothetical protein
VHKRFTIIGVGTLGGFLAEALSNLENTEALTFIDFDEVQTKNLINSIYRPLDVGLRKVEALKDIINEKNSEIEIKTLDECFVEGYTKIPQSDIVFDCRDFIYDRKGYIDVRAYISARYVILDCRRNVKYKVHQEGQYITPLNKDDLRTAAFIIASLVRRSEIDTLIKTNSVSKYDIDFIKEQSIKECEIIYDENDNEDRLINFKENIIPIIQENNRADIEVLVGDPLNPTAKKVIPRGVMRSSHDIVINLISLIDIPCTENNFVICMKDGKIELIPETGAA